MSRITYSDDCYDADAADMLRGYAFAGNCDRALKGKKGQKALRELVAALEALPEKRLAKGFVETKTGEVCALGALARARGCDVSRFTRYAEWDWDDDVTSLLAKALGITFPLAWQVMDANDNLCAHCTPEKRYERVLAWARSQITEGDA